MLARVDTRPRRKNSQRARKTKRVDGYLKWLRGRPCAVGRSGGCSEGMEAAHVDFLGNKGMATKTEDWNAIPLCRGHHAAQHDTGWLTFQAAHHFDAAMSAKSYWESWLRTSMGRDWQASQ